MTREQAAKIKSKFITEKQKALMKSTSAIEKVLLNKIFDQLFVMLGDGKTIVSDTGAELKISEVINKVFADFKKNENLKLINEIGDNMIAIATLNQNYFTTIAKNAKQLKKIYKEVDTNMKSRIGIDKNNQLASGGFLDSLLGDTKLKNAVLAETRAAFGNKNVTTQTYLNKIREVIVGNEQHMGALSSYYRGFVHDTYSQFNNEYADKVATRLELNAAVYEGGLINTSREFCIKKNGKVFTRAEIAAWKDDPDLLMTKDEKKAGAPIDYVPHRDRGRWECRHDLNWIPDDEAIRMRPDLKGVLGTPDAVVPKETVKPKEKPVTKKEEKITPIESDTKSQEFKTSKAKRRKIANLPLLEQQTLFVESFDNYYGFTKPSDTLDISNLDNIPLFETLSKNLKLHDELFPLPNRQVDSVDRDIQPPKYKFDVKSNVTWKGVMNPQTREIAFSSEVAHGSSVHVQSNVFNHEMGHLFDNQLSTAARLDSTRLLTEYPFKKTVLSDVLKTIKKSDEYNRIKNLIEDGKSGKEFLVEIKELGSMSTKMPKELVDYLEYLESDYELFARAYSQYIAYKSGINEMSSLLEKSTSGGSYFPFPLHWTSRESFAKIFDEFEKLSKLLNERASLGNGK